MIFIPLRNDSFYFMRKQGVDVLRYLPEFLAEDPTFKKIQDALSREHESYRLKLVDISKQFYIETADWGLKDWEQFLKITPKKNSGNEKRRAVIAVKRRGGQMMTVAHTKEVMREFAPYGEVDIEELGENRLKLIINNGNFEWDELLQALWDLLPAHLTFDFGIYEDFGEEGLTFAQAAADATWENFELDMLSPNTETVCIGIFPVDISTDTFGLSEENFDFDGNLKVGILEQESEYITIDCDRSEILDEETIEDFERYIRQRWKEFKTNPVVKHYKHGTHGDDWDGETDDDEPEYFPVDTDFLRIYWQFDCPNDSDGAGGTNYHLRYQTILRPKDNLQPSDINYLSAVGAASGMLLHSKLNIPTTGIIRALYIKKSELKIV